MDGKVRIAAQMMAASRGSRRWGQRFKCAIRLRVDGRWREVAHEASSGGTQGVA
jgi:hypothetical protein